MTVAEFIGEQVHRRMWRDRILQREVGERLGISQSALSLKLHGRRPWTVDELLMTVEILGGDLADYLPERSHWPQPCAVRDLNSEPAGKAYAQVTRLHLAHAA